MKAERFVFGFLALTWLPAVSAAPLAGDSDHPITIEADWAEADDKKRVAARLRSARDFSATLYPVEIEIDNSSSERSTVLLPNWTWILSTKASGRKRITCREFL